MDTVNCDGNRSKWPESMLYRNLIKSLYSDLFRTRIHGFLAVYMRANLSSLVFKSAPIPFQFSYLPFLGCAVDVFLYILHILRRVVLVSLFCYFDKSYVADRLTIVI